MQHPEPDPRPGGALERVAVVVLNWNGWRDTVACLASLRNLHAVPHVIVVDNGSADGSGDRIRAAAPWVQFVQLPTNRGFAGGMNAGITAALRDAPLVDYVWILNNDTLVEPATLSRMVAVADSDSRIGIVGSRLVDADGSGRIQAMGGGTVNRWLGTTWTHLGPSSKPYDYLCGASLLVRRALLSRVGGFDERYFFYLEDTDLGVRSRRAGWKLAAAQDATVIHRRGASVDGGSPARSLRSDVYLARSSAIFVSGLDMPWRCTAIPLRLLGMLANRLARYQADRLIPLARAYVDGLRIGRCLPEIPVFDDLEPTWPMALAGWHPARGSTERSPRR